MYISTQGSKEYVDMTTSRPYSPKTLEWEGKHTAGTVLWSVYLKQTREWVDIILPVVGLMGETPRKGSPALGVQPPPPNAQLSFYLFVFKYFPE